MPTGQADRALERPSRLCGISFLEEDLDGPGLLGTLSTRPDLPPPSYVLHSSPGRLHVLWRVLTAQIGQGGNAMSFCENGAVRIHYEQFGTGFPLMLIAGGGLNSTIAGLNSPFNAIEEFKKRVPLHCSGSAQCLQRPVHRPAGDRPPAGCPQ